MYKQIKTSVFIQEENPWSATWNRWGCGDTMPGHFKTVTEETDGNKNVVPTENATNLMA